MGLLSLIFLLLQSDGDIAECALKDDFHGYRVVKSVFYADVQFLDEEKFKETAHKLQELGLFFNLKHFEDEMHNGNLDEVEKYLSGFTKVDDSRVSHPMVSGNTVGLGSLSVSAALKHPRTPTNTSFDYPSFVKVEMNQLLLTKDWRGLLARDEETVWAKLLQG
ncbi:hypothetical protein QVD17_02657 [Tagetes erecta]|uniref:TPR1-like CTLH-containing domain-containing protein n=1 Tax=Tagetes erecta TaxID=13708 RepID=A0AAD8P2V8_TARER|nr:hypothetical protein QVD17_07877 [Tagetes erecta]KAK1436873.1 hypothetical protein QVD17_02657 [Tagetes erecta]